MKESTHLAITLAVTGAVMAGLLAWLAAALVSLGETDTHQNDRLRALESVQHSHTWDGRPLYPPHWRPR